MDDLDKLVAKMRELGIRHYKTADIDISLDDSKPGAVSNSPPVDQRKLENTIREQRHRVMFGATPLIPSRKSAE